MPVYRYQSNSVNAAQLANQVLGPTTLGSTGPGIFVDVTASNADKGDLDAYMTSIGYSYVSTDPVTTPMEESASTVTTWATVSAALGGQAGASANYVFKSNGSGGGSMTKNIQVVPNRVTVSTGGDCDFTSIASAVAYAIAQGASATVPWEVLVQPGSYTEPPMTIQAGVTLRGMTTRLDTVYVTASNPNADLFTFSNGGSVSGLNCRGVTDPVRCIFRAPNANTLAVLHGVSVKGCSNGLVVSGGAKAVTTYFSVNLTATGEGITGIAAQVTGAGSYLGMVSAFFSCPSALLPGYAVNPVQTCVSVDSGGELYMVGSTARVAPKDSTADVVFVDGGSFASVLSTEISNSGNAFHIGSAGTGTTVLTSGVVFSSNTLNYLSDSSTSKIFIGSTSDIPRNSLTAGTSFNGIGQYRSDGFSRLIGNGWRFQYDTGKEANISDFITDQSSTGVCDGGEVSAANGLNVDVTAGDGWIVRPDPDDDAFWVEWTSVTSLSLAANTTNYVCYDSNTSAIVAQTSPTSSLQILLATVITDGSGIRFLHNTRYVIDAPAFRIQDFLLDAHKITAESGMLTSQGTSNRKFGVASGSYYRSLTQIAYAGSGTDATFSYFYGTNGATEVASQTQLDVTDYDNAGTLTPIPNGEFRSDTVYVTSDGRVSVIYGTQAYATQVLAEAAPLGNPPTFIQETAYPSAKIVVQQGQGGIVAIVDTRPTFGSQGSTVGGITVHGALSGLSADDHTQYLLVSGARAMSGSLNMGTNAITGATTVNGITVEAHASRHDPGGADALALGTPVAIQVGASPGDGTAATLVRSDHQHGITTGAPVSIGTANASGSASSVARSDHVHDHGAQTSGTLHAAATGSVAGFLSTTDKTKLDGIASGAAALTASAPANVTKAAAAVGVATDAARADHKHDITTAAAGASTPGDAAAEGTATSIARSDHQHSMPAFGSTAGTFCQGDDSRLSDDRTASGIRTATTVVAVSAAAAPAANQALVATGSAAATWQAPISPSGEIQSTATRTTTSTTDVLMTGMTVTPPAGTYLVWFSGSENGLAATITFDIWSGGALVTSSERIYASSNTTNRSPFCCVARVTVNGSQAIEGRWRTSTGTATCTRSSLAYLKVA